MDWNMKEASWDLTELDQAAAAASTPDREAIDGSSRFAVERRKGEFSVDLKLGQMENSSNEPVVSKWKDVGGVSRAASSPSSKRARAINNGTQAVSCLVDGCNSDLSNCRDYHRRHKVCELHSKTPMVTIGGHKQRFCQQCSRFHSLEEFDEGKRSCRKRLDGHNRRRRKPQAEAFARSGSFLSNYQGTQLLPFSSSHVYPSTVMVNPAWNAEARRHNQAVLEHNLVHKQDLLLGSASTCNYKEGNKQQLAFLQGLNSTSTPPQPPPPASVSQTLLGTTALSSPLHDRDRDSHCALSLLSSSPLHTRTSGSVVLSPMLHPHHSLALTHQSLGLSLHDHNLESVDPVLDVPGGTDHCAAMYDTNEAPHSFPFHWE